LAKFTSYAYNLFETNWYYLISKDLYDPIFCYINSMS